MAASGLTIDGLASGIDTKSVVEQLVALERAPINAMSLRKANLETRQGAWKDINSRLLSLQSKAEALQSPTAFMAVRATSSDASLVAASSTGTAITGSYRISVARLATIQTSRSADFAGSLSTAAGLDGTLVLSDAGGATKATLTIAANESLNSIKDRINGQTATTGVAASIVQVDTGTFKLVLSGTKTGVAFGANWSGGGVLADLNAPAQQAQKAEFTVNGLTIRSESNTVADAIPGVTLNLLKAPVNPAQPLEATVAVERSTDTIVSSLKSLVEQFNSLTTFIADKQTWDKEKKVGGILLGDSLAGSIVRDARRQLTDPVRGLPAGQLSTLADIGITSGKYGTADYGKLVIDETKLRAKLSEAPDQVAALFTGDSGAAKRLADYAKGFTDPRTGIIPGKDKDMVSQLHDMTDRIDAMNARITRVQERYTAQFQALETALSKLKNQQSWLTAQLNQLSGS